MIFSNPASFHRKTSSNDLAILHCFIVQNVKKQKTEQTVFFRPHSYWWSDFLLVVPLQPKPYVAFFVAVYHMKETGWEKISQDDVGKLHYQYLTEKWFDDTTVKHSVDRSLLLLGMFLLKCFRLVTVICNGFSSIGFLISTYTILVAIFKPPPPVGAGGGYMFSGRPSVPLSVRPWFTW